jgi:hypothetical protein
MKSGEEHLPSYAIAIVSVRKLTSFVQVLISLLAHNLLLFIIGSIARR